MIKKINIENLYGIKKFSADFAIADFDHSHANLSEQVLSLDGTNIMGIPTFLAKNSTGKTSIINAIMLVKKFGTFDGINNILKSKIIKVIATFEQSVDSSYSYDGSDYKMPFEDRQKFASQIMTSLYDEYRYADSQVSKLDIEFGSGSFFSVEMTASDVVIEINGKRISIIKKIMKVLDVNFSNNVFLIRQEVKEILFEAVKDFPFLHNERIEKNEIHQNITDLNHKFNSSEVSSNIRQIISTFGFESLKKLLRSLDPHVSTINNDIKNHHYEILFKDGFVPVSPNNLSYGTRKIISIFAKAIPILINGGVLMIDEVENGLHLSLIRLIIELFVTEEINVSNAQLFLTSHNPLLFERKIVRPHNMFIYNKGEFVKGYNLTLDVNSDSYYNDLYWLDRNLDSSSTMNSFCIQDIIGVIIESVEDKENG